jgi:PAS domain S-box-containing protein
MSMLKLKDLTIRCKLVLVIMATCLVALILSGTSMVVMERIVFRRFMADFLMTQAEMTAENCKAALAFEDKNAAADALRALHVEPSISLGYVSDKDGNLLADYHRDQIHMDPHLEEPKEDGYSFNGGILTVYKRITLDGERIGRICLQSDLHPMYEMFRRNTRMVIVVMFFSSLVALLMSSTLQKVISKPIISLTKLTRGISEEKDYSRRAPGQGSGELGLLVGSFNEMLEQIQQRDEALVDSKTQLERKVEDRTAELSASNAQLTIEVSERRQAEEALRRRDAILEAVSLAAEKFMRTNSYRQHIQNVLGQLGQAASVSRVYIFENDGGGDNGLLTSQRYEWVKFGVAPEIDNPELQGLSYRESGIGRWEENLAQGKAIHGLVRDLPILERNTLEPQGIQSILVVPIFVGSEWWGFIGFDECTSEREWATTEIETLKTAADILGAAIQREHVEESLRESLDFQKKLIAVAATGIFTVDKDDNITAVNDEISRVTGYTSEELVGKQCEILGGKPYRHNCELLDLLQTGPIFRQNDTMRAKDGRLLTILRNADLIRDEEGQITGGIESFVDVTDLHEAKEAAEAANTAKSEFLANMSHELRTPLHGILSFSSFGIKRHGTVTQEKLLNYFEKINQSGHILLALLNDLLDLAKLESGKMQFEVETVNLGVLATSVVDEFQSLTSERNLSVECTDLNDDGPTMLDPEKIQQVIRNLLSNAVKFSPDGGTIKVNMTRETKSKITSVCDQGPGIPEGELETVFDKFVQSSKTKSGAGGTGLGLAICKEIITSHGGRIWAENRPEGGAMFSFELPCSRCREAVSVGEGSHS